MAEGINVRSVLGPATWSDFQDFAVTQGDPEVKCPDAHASPSRRSNPLRRCATTACRRALGLLVRARADRAEGGLMTDKHIDKAKGRAKEAAGALSEASPR